MRSELQIFLENEEATLDFGRNLAVATSLKEFTSKEILLLEIRLRSFEMPTL